MTEVEIEKLLEYHKKHYGEWSTLSQDQIEEIGDYFAQHQYEYGQFEADREVTAYGCGNPHIVEQTERNYELLQDIQAGRSNWPSGEYLEGYLSRRD